MNVSKFSELYTRLFATKIARCIRCGVQVREEVSLVAHGEEGSNVKRRKLSHKQAPNEAYQPQVSWDDRINTFLQQALTDAPRVGKRYVTQGNVFNQAQHLFPEYHRQGLEMCKGADRYRPPPTNMSKEQCPFRMTLGIRRDGKGNFYEDLREEWGKLKRKQLLRKVPPAPLIVTLFASMPSFFRAPEVTTAPSGGEDSERMAKRQCIRRLPTGDPTSEVSSAPSIAAAELPHNPTEIPTANNQLPVPISEEAMTPQSLPDSSATRDPEPLKTCSHGPKFMSLTSEERQQLTRMHNNLGHPDSVVLGHVLREQGWPQAAIDGIRDMHCPACHERQRPRLARPSHLNMPRGFNEVVSMDAVTWTNNQGQDFMFYHMIDAGTNFQVAFPCTHRPTSTELSLLINRHWVSWAGPPRELITDSAGEFCSEEFSRYLQSMDTKGHTVAAEAHWQLGRCERHGAILQTMLDKYQQDQIISSDMEFEMALQHCCAAKNSLSRYRGYSPEIRVLGKSRHVPASNLNEEAGPADMLADQ
eukprot:s1984_g16.t1